VGHAEADGERRHRTPVDSGEQCRTNSLEASVACSTLQMGKAITNSSPP